MAVNEHNVVVIGGGGVGKSCVTIQLVRAKFVTEYDPTIEDQYRKQLTVDGEACLLEILDTAGQEEFSAMKDQYYRSGQGFLLVYAINDRQTFGEMQKFRERIMRVKEGASAPMVVIGNKCDLTASDREVTTEEVKAVVGAWKVPFFETSAKTNTNINECFQQLVREIRKADGRQQPAASQQGKKKKGKGGCTIL